MNAPQKLALAAVLAGSAAALAACEKPIVAPDDKGVCWHVVTQADGTLKFNKLSSNVENMETCAANLEAMRINFRRLGQPNKDIIGAYQANFLFLQSEGVLVGRTLSSARYVALVRTGDGRLAIPGAMPQEQNLPPLDAPQIGPNATPEK